MNISKVKSIKKVTFSDECGPIKPEYKDLQARINTFERRSWPPSIPVKPQELADAGFYYTGNVRLFIRTKHFSIYGDL